MFQSINWFMAMYLSIMGFPFALAAINYLADRLDSARDALRRAAAAPQYPVEPQPVPVPAAA